jgi:hypothetical protein
MAYEIGLTTITAEAGQDLSAKQFYFGTIAADGQVDPTAAAAAADGVIMGKPDAAGKVFPLATQPGQVVKVVAGAAVARGALLEADASGRAVTQAAGKILGKALAAAGAAGEIIPALLILQR